MSELRELSVKFTEYQIKEEGGDLDFKKYDNVVEKIKTAGINFVPAAGTYLTSTTMESAIKENNNAFQASTTVAGGDRVSAIWRFNDSTRDSDPGEGKFKAVSSQKKFNISNFINYEGINFRNLLLLLGGSSFNIYLQNKDSPGYALYKGSGIGVADSDYLEFLNIEQIDFQNFVYKDGNYYILIITKIQGEEINNVSIPALPVDNSGNYNLVYDSNNQNLNWQS